MFHTQQIIQQAKKSFDYCSNICVNNSSSSFATNYFSLLSSVTEKALHLNKMTMQGIMASTILATKLLSEKTGKKIIGIRKVWRNAWKSLTIKRNNCSDAVIFDGRVIVKKRGPLLCAFINPCKIRCNRKAIIRRFISSPLFLFMSVLMKQKSPLQLNFILTKNPQ